MQPYVDIPFRLPGEEKSDKLLALELKIANRADELVRLRGTTGLNLYCWMLAEAEIFGVGQVPVSHLHRSTRSVAGPLHT